jgi:hypothetical protein
LVGCSSPRISARTASSTSASNVICRRCRSSPHTIPTGDLLARARALDKPNGCPCSSRGGPHTLNVRGHWLRVVMGAWYATPSPHALVAVAPVGPGVRSRSRRGPARRGTLRNLTGVGDEMLSARVGGSPYLPWLQPGDVRVQVECDRDVGAAEALLYDLRGDSGFQRE